MIVPKEVIWQELRAEALTTIPPESRASLEVSNSLAQWYRRGYFTVQRATKRQIELRTAPADFGSAMLADVEHLLDCAAEHQVCLWRHINAAVWLSPAWLTVTFYYWAYFLGLALTRLIGQTVWFLDGPAVRSLLALAPPPLANPGSGCFLLCCGNVTTVTEREVTLMRTGGRLHDELWSLWSRICESKLNRLASGSMLSAEERLFTALTRSAQLLGRDWQSAFRNEVNYRVGFAYSAVRRDRVLAPFSYLRNPPHYEYAVLLEALESNLVKVQGVANPLRSEPQAVTALLVHYTFALHALTGALYSELLDRHRLDHRWAQSRFRFLKSNGVSDCGEAWPC